MLNRTIRVLCILLSYIFFVSCNTASHKSIIDKSASGVDTTATSKIRASTFLVMQACPVMTSVMSTIRAKKTVQTSDSIFHMLVNMMNKKDSQGKTWRKRIIAEVHSPECKKSIIELKQAVCSHKAYSKICKGPYEIEGVDVEILNELFNFRTFRGGL